MAYACYAAGGMPLAFTQEDFLVYNNFFDSIKMFICVSSTGIPSMVFAFWVYFVLLQGVPLARYHLIGCLSQLLIHSYVICVLN